MHQYMKSIGFGNIRDKKQLTQILKDVEESYTQHQLVTQDETTDLCEFEKEYGEGIGIKVCGDMDIDEQFEYRYYTPYFKGSGGDILCGCQCGTKDRPGSICGHL